MPPISINRARMAAQLDHDRLTSHDLCQVEGVPFQVAQLDGRCRISQAWCLSLEVGQAMSRRFREASGTE